MQTAKVPALRKACLAAVHAAELTFLEKLDKRKGSNLRPQHSYCALMPTELQLFSFSKNADCFQSAKPATYF